MASSDLRERVCIGIVQTTLDSEVAWSAGPQISVTEQIKAANEIDRGLLALKDEAQCPEIVLLPELSVPRPYIPRLQAHANELNAVIIAGVDYRRFSSGGRDFVCNDAILVMPRNWVGMRARNSHPIRRIGKTYAAEKEAAALTKAGFQFSADPSVWLFDGGPIGKFAVAICFDFLDLERMALYRAQIQHLFVLAYNRDTSSFANVAESVARTTFCNVVICNTGHHGGSLAVSPYYQPYRRTIYRNEGAGLFAAQSFSLPVRELHEHQRNPNETFKGLPPGFRKQTVLLEKSAKV